MSRLRFHNFWGKVQVAFPWLSGTAVSERKRLSDEFVDGLLAGSDRWLTPYSAGGFERTVFEFLPPDELERLTNAVAGVRAVADELQPNVPATSEQRARALPHFKAILKVLEFDRYADADAFLLGKVIEKELAHHRSIQSLDHLRFMTGSDSTGDPALWVWAFVKESGEHDEQAFFKGADEIDPPLKRAAEEVAPDRLTYISYRSTLDQLELEVAA